jgi:hypothetical protein
MPLQNRVDPFGDIHPAAERGLFTGNRGVIHDPGAKTLLRRRWTTRAWIICVCEFRGRQREVMGRNTPSGAAGWTELFFLDEVTALAAGHRPCFYCRREQAEAFVAACAEAFGGTTPKAPQLDARLHGERLASCGTASTVNGEGFDALPDGAVLARGRQCFAKRNGVLRAWTFGGYGKALEFARLALEDVRLLTPKTTLAALKAGYRPTWHPTIGTVVKSGT